MASQSKAVTIPKGKLSARRWGALCAGAGAAALVLPAAARTTGFAAPARTAVLASAPTTAPPALGADAAQGASTLGRPSVLAAGGMAAAAALAAGAASKKPRRGARAVAQRAAGPCAGALGKKASCLHPDKPVMFACADCPRRTGIATQADGSADVAIAAYFGEDPAIMAKKTQCLHPDKPMMMACADCPRRGGKACATECTASATAAYIGEGGVEAALSSAKKTQCIHPDKPMMFACSDCPRRSSKTSAVATAEFEGAEVAAAAFVGEGSCGGTGKKTQCIHPDKPMMFACADCPRRGKAAVPAHEEFDGTDCAVAAYVGESSGAGALGKKTQCLHPDKPMAFACGDCPRRGGKAPAAEAEGADLAAAAFVGEAEAAAKKTQCIHPDKPMMFACADCPRRGGKAPVAELDGEEVAVAAYTGECACEGAAMSAKKTQCIHPDKPMMFACADCPRRGGFAPETDVDTVAAAAFVGDGALVNAKKTQCIHPDKPMMFACADCPRRGKAPVAQAEMDGEAVATAAYAGEGACAVSAKKTQCIHPDKPMMFACADCPRRGKAPNTPEAAEDPEVAVAAFVSESACSSPCVVSKKDFCLHPDKPMAFACGDCPRRG